MLGFELQQEALREVAPHMGEAQHSSSNAASSQGPDQVSFRPIPSGTEMTRSVFRSLCTRFRISPSSGLQSPEIPPPLPKISRPIELVHLTKIQKAHLSINLD